MARIRSTLLALLIPVFVASCGGGDGGEDSGDPNWETVNPPGTKGSFSLPKPVKQEKVQDMMVYTGAKKGNVEFWITVFNRNGVQLGDSDADGLAIFEEQRLEGQKTRLMEKGFNPQMVYEKDIAVENGLGQQIRMNLGDQFILNRFYMTPDTFYHVKIDNGDESNPDVKQFIDSFDP